MTQSALRPAPKPNCPQRHQAVCQQTQTSTHNVECWVASRRCFVGVDKTGVPCQAALAVAESAVLYIQLPFMKTTFFAAKQQICKHLLFAAQCSR